MTNKDTTPISDEMVKEFFHDYFYQKGADHVSEAWESFKSKHSQPSGRDWEIVSFVAKDGWPAVEDSPLWRIHGGESKGIISYETCLETCSIHTVRRLSDNTTWTIGEDTPKGKIKEFELPHPDGLMYVRYDLGGWDYLSQCKKAPIPEQKPVLFITEDGKDIFMGDSYWCVRDNWFVASCNTSDYNFSYNVKRFSTETAANEYVLMNKPILSINEIIYKIDIAWVDSPILEKLKQLAQSKIK